MKSQKGVLFQNKFHWIYLAGLCLIVALPLLALPPWFSPPDWGKTIVFRIILSILIFLFLWQIFPLKLREQFSLRLKRTGMTFWLLAALLGIYLLATIFSLDPVFSFWGSPHRSDGFLNFAFYIIFGILAFLILDRDGWKKVLNFAILIGVLVSLVAIFQWQGLFQEVLVAAEHRPPATLGNPIMLALYLLLLSFLTLSLAIKANPLYKKILYFLVLFIFLFTILLTYSRAVYLGLAVGFLYFIFFYPYQKRIVSLVLKSALLIIFLFGAYGVYYINTQPQLPEFIQENKTLKGFANRLSIETALQDPRISGWKVSWQALKDRPILGYGPENFSIGFDKHYDPFLRGIEKMPGGVENWWDRAHNFVFDISVSAGIPALLIFLSLFGVLLFKLGKAKETGIQAAFIGYLVANFFSFDTFSIYLILFLLIGYSLHLVEEAKTSSPSFAKSQICATHSES